MDKITKMKKILFSSQFNLSLMICLFLSMNTLSLNSMAFAKNALEKIDFSSMPGDKLQIKMAFKEAVPKPSLFTIDSPARIVMDFKNIDLTMGHTKQSIGVGNVLNINAIQSQGRVRVVLDLVKLTDYVTKIDGNNLFLTLNNPNNSKGSLNEHIAISDIDFRRGNNGEGLIILNFTHKVGNINIQDEGDKIIVNMDNIQLPDELERRLNVVDFATPVKMIDTFRNANGVRMVIDAQGEYDHLGYQVNNQFTIEIKSLTKEEKADKLKSRFGYSGERLSLIFQDIEVRAVLQLIADFTGKNMVTSDTVSGNITLRLKNVPWDQALDIVLKTKGLAMREEGNVIRVGPMEEIANIEKQELEAKKQIVSLLPRIRETIQLNYRRATVVVELLKSLSNEESSNSKSTDTGSASATDNKGVISSNATLIGDDRTNKIIVFDNRENIEALRKLIDEIDVPTKQVMIDARVVSATTTFTEDLGVSWGVMNSTAIKPGGNSTTLAHTGVNLGSSLATVDATITNNVNAGRGAIGLSSAILGNDWLLDLELQAAQTDGTAEIVSSPRVASANGETALIKSGEKIPYTTVSQDGTETGFEDAVLSLEVTPNITPNNKIEMKVVITNDSDSGRTATGVPIINTQELTTSIIVNNGDTVVLGGIFTYNKSHDEQKIPLLGDIPVVGNLFKGTKKVENKRELLIFITPRILNSNVSIK